MQGIGVVAANRRSGSGFGGKIARELEFLDPATVAILSSNRQAQALRVAGGGGGASGENAVLRADGRIERLSGNDRTELARVTSSRCTRRAVAASGRLSRPLAATRP